MNGEKEVNRLLVIGSGVASRSLIQSVKQQYPLHKITVVRKDPEQVVPCAIPYIFQRLQPESIKISDDNWLQVGAEVLDDIVLEIDRDNKQLHLAEEGELSYDKLIIATGAEAIRPPISGYHLNHVYTVDKNLDTLRSLYARLEEARRVIIIGGGFIGVELADELSRKEHLESLHLVEAEKQILPRAFDEEVAEEVEQELGAKVRIHKEVLLQEIIGEEEVQGVLLSNGEKIPADTVICAIGVTPRSSLAKNAGLLLGNDHGIAVDDYFYTSDPNIMACGDCTSKRDQISGKLAPVRLASSAAREGILAGINLHGRILASNPGVINNFSTKVGKTAFAAAGMREEDAQGHHYQIAVVNGVFPNRHPVKFADVEENRVKLIFNQVDGRLLGGQVRGDNSVSELVNLIGTGVQQKLTVFDLVSNQYATHPLLTTGPSGYPLLKLSVEACKILGKFERSSMAEAGA